MPEQARRDEGHDEDAAQQGIRVNGVAAGLIETELHAAAGEPDRPMRLGTILVDVAGGR